MKKTVDEILRQYVDELPREKEKDLRKFRARVESRPLAYQKKRDLRPAMAWSCAVAAVLCVCVLGVSLLHFARNDGASVPGQDPSDKLVFPIPPNIPDLSAIPEAPVSVTRVVTLADSLGKETKICNGVLQLAGVHLYGEEYRGYEIGAWGIDTPAGDSASTPQLPLDILEEFVALGVATNQTTLAFYPAHFGSIREADFLGEVLEPSVYASQISVAPLRYADGDSQLLGACLRLNTLEPGAVRSIEAYYVSNGYEVKELASYGALEAGVQWMGYEIRYAVYENEDGGCVYRLYFQNGKSYCCMQARSSEMLEIMTFLAEVFA